jgi:chaperonin GroEL
MIQGKMPEFLDNGAVIARRVVMLPNRIEDVGAMFLREMLGKVQDTAGDGTATAALLFRSIYDQGLHYIAAGGSGMTLRRHLEAAALELVEELERQTLPLTDKAQVVAFAKTICDDPDLAEALAEAFDMLGADGRLETRKGRNRQLVLEFFDGVYWGGGLFSREPAINAGGKIHLVTPAIVMTDLEIKEPQELLPLLDMACEAGLERLVLLVSKISDTALALLNMPANRARLQVMAVKAPVGTLMREELKDMALLVGGRPLLEQMGDRLEKVKLEDLGHSRRAWADKEYFGIEGGQGDPRNVRGQIAGLRKKLAQATDSSERTQLQNRIGMLINGSAVLWVGAATPVELEARQARTTQMIETLRGVLRAGVLPGGGVALLGLKPGLQKKLRRAEDTDEQMAYRILLKALDVPTRTLLSNAGFGPDSILGEIARQPCGYGFDVLAGEVREMKPAGIMDSAMAIKTALYHATFGAALALTIDVLIQRANPPLGIKRQ